jgi:hypothetical protein
MRAGVDSLLSVGGADPLLLRRRIGRGHSLLWTAGLGGDWHAMVVHPVYPVFFIRLFNRAAANQMFPLNLPPGAPLIHRTAATEMTLQRPAGTTETVTARHVQGRRYIRIDDTADAGEYVLLPPDGDETAAVRFHVRADPHESDYRPLADSDRSHLTTQLGALHKDEQSLISAVGAHYGGQPMDRWLALALVALLLAECGLARRWFG